MPGKWWLCQVLWEYSNRYMPMTKLTNIIILDLSSSGSHTIGQARCTTFRTRIYNEANIDASFKTSLQANCPSSGGDNTLSPLDTQTPTNFDNAYYTNLVNKKGLLHSDQQLFNGGTTDAVVNTYSTRSTTFFTDFANAMVKMGNLSPLTGTSGQIRTNCRKTNWFYLCTICRPSLVVFILFFLFWQNNYVCMVFLWFDFVISA